MRLSVRPSHIVWGFVGASGLMLLSLYVCFMNFICVFVCKCGCGCMCVCNKCMCVCVISVCVCMCMNVICVYVFCKFKFVTCTYNMYFQDLHRVRVYIFVPRVCYI